MTVLAIGDSNLLPSRTDSLSNEPPRKNRDNTAPIFANQIGHDFRCWAKGGASNHWMLKHVNYLLENIDRFENPIIMVGWSQWERSEWEWNGDSLSFSVAPYYDVPEELQKKYQEWRQGITPETIGTQRIFWHNILFQVHQKLEDLKIPHLFWSTYDNFVGMNPRHDWNNCWFKPYDPDGCMKQWFMSKNIPSMGNDPWHWATDGHRAWGTTLADFFREHHDLQSHT